MSINLMQYRLINYLMRTFHWFFYFALLHSLVLQKEPSLSFSFYLPSSFSREIPSLSLAGLFSSRKGESHILTPLSIYTAYGETHVNYPLLLSIHPCCFFCRYVSDAVTGVIIVSILFFFPSQKPSLSWWFDPQGQWAFILQTYHYYYLLLMCVTQWVW